MELRESVRRPVGGGLPFAPFQSNGRVACLPCTSGTNCFLLCGLPLGAIFKPKIRCFLKSDPFFRTLMSGKTL